MAKRRKVANTQAENLPAKRKVTKALARQGGYHEAGGLAYAARFLDGGRNQLVEIARCSKDPKVQAVIKDWDGLTDNTRRQTKLENLCEGHELTPGEFLGRVAQDAHDTGLDLSKLIRGLAYPRVMQATIKNAMKADGFRDRQLLAQTIGELKPAGQVINVKATAAAQAVTEQPRGLPSFEHEAIATTAAVKGGGE